MQWIARGLGLYAELQTPNRLYRARIVQGLDAGWAGTVIVTETASARLRGRDKEKRFTASTESGAIALVEQWINQRIERI